MTVSGRTPVERKEDVAAGWPRVRWGAVFAGLVIVIVMQFLLSIFGLAVGLTAVDPRQGAPGAEFGWGAAIWGIVTLFVSLFVGGWLAGRLAGVFRAGDGALNGILVWALSLLAMVYLVGSGLGTLMGGLFGVVGGLAQTAGTIAGQGAVGGRDVESQAREAARGAGIDLDRARQQAEEAAQQVGRSGTGANQQARETTARAADYAATGAWSLLVAALIGLALAAWGGAMGARAEGRRVAV